MDGGAGRIIGRTRSISEIRCESRGGPVGIGCRVRDACKREQEEE